ncbi:MAG TPA: hypothetical protein PKK94_02775 [Leptospiraceae bacterium]|nr:hypothetical protein [Leptospiraceae bacterium]HNO21875.1 hypothetical protein [Leptospiraceae bacterium]
MNQKKRDFRQFQSRRVSFKPLARAAAASMPGESSNLQPKALYDQLNHKYIDYISVQPKINTGTCSRRRLNLVSNKTIILYT